VKPILEISGLSKYFKDRSGGIITAVEDVSLSMAKGEILGLVGQSGSGKTTLGRIAVGLTRPSKGTVMLDGIDVGKTKDLNQLWRKAQYVHQDPYGSLDPYLTVREVLDRPLRYLLHVQRQELDDRTARIMSVIGLKDEFLPKRIQELSGGERQRVLLARAFVITPVFVVCDEPTTMIDFVHRNSILDLLRRLRTEFETTFMLITHDLSIAADICDNIAIMQNARIVEVGSMKQVLESPREEYTKALLAATPDKLVSESN
jgi:ABC-type glutathione transport system ATPase component